jgi:subtilase family serine protease
LRIRPTAGWSRRIAAAATATAAVVFSALGAAAPAGAAAATVKVTPHVTWKNACSAPKPGYAACNAKRVTGGVTEYLADKAAKQGVAPQDVTPHATTPSGFGPSDLQSAYGLTSAAASNGSGHTIAIVDAYDDPNAEADLAKYRSYYGLSACTTANGCFKKVSQTGSTTSLPSGDSGWAEEISLDVDMASAMCPKCNILLVEATSASYANLGTAVNEAVKLGAKYVSNSYGGSDSSSDSSYDTAYYKHAGVAITVSSGDSGYGVEYPASSQYVTAVGGTALTKSGSTTRGWTETAWSDAGSGCSSYETKPSWQTDTSCSKRVVADVSAVADPNTGVSVYDSYGVTAGWYTFGGTSVSSPIIAGVYALAGTPSSGSYPSSFPYAHTSSLNDVTSGSNGSCSVSYYCTARSGYDGPTGLGTPSGTTAFAG